MMGFINTIDNLQSNNLNVYTLWGRRDCFEKSTTTNPKLNVLSDSMFHLSIIVLLAAHQN